MSASSTTRLARLIARVAQERAARGRPPQISRPVVARQGFRRREDDDGERRTGSAAEFVSFGVHPISPDRIVERVVRLVDAEGRYVGDVVQPMPTRMRIVSGIDYADLLSRYETEPGEPQIPVSAQAPEPLPADEKDLIDILFPE